jgi:hypothetical protein
MHLQFNGRIALQCNLQSKCWIALIALSGCTTLVSQLYLSHNSTLLDACRSQACSSNFRHAAW